MNTITSGSGIRSDDDLVKSNDTAADLNESSALVQETLRLRREVSELRAENTKLRHQCYLMSLYMEKARRATNDTVDIPGLEPLSNPTPGSLLTRPNDLISTADRIKANEELHHVSATGGRKFKLQWDLRDHHNGAVSVAKFSPNGLLLASGSVDSSLRIWSLQDKLKWKNTDHRMNVTDLAWSDDSLNVLSSSLDGTCKWHDVEIRTVLGTFASSGLVLSCALVSSTAMFACSDMRKQISIFDLRSPASAVSVTSARNVVTTLCVEPNGWFLITGDNAGLLQVYDIRRMARTSQDGSGGSSPIDTPTDALAKACSDPLRHTMVNDETGAPVTHIHQACDATHFQNARFLVVNAYDSVIRLYDRGSFDGDIAEHFTRYKLRHSFVGHKNRNYPIRSSSWVGTPSQSAPKDEDGYLVTAPRSILESTLIATGSTDANVYVYDASDPSEKAPVLLQKLEGHRDIVYGTHFHPSEPMLCSYSSDASIKIWVPTKVK